MRQRLKNIYLQLRNDHPRIGALLFRIRNGGLMRRIKINGPKQAVKVSIAPSCVIKNLRIYISGGNHKVIIGPEAIINDVNILLKNRSNTLLIGSGVRFNKGGSIVFEDNDGSITIGESSTFENVHLAVTGNCKSIKIGQGCMFAYDIDVRTGDSHAVLDVEGNKINHEKDVVFGSHVWVAAHVTILKGVTIGANSIVATRSTVTKSFGGENLLIGGSPAQILKTEINWCRDRYPNGAA